MGKITFNVVLPTKTKMFCSCPIGFEGLLNCEEELRAAKAAEEAGLHSIYTCPVCTGEKGVFPVLNKQAVEEGIAVILALGGAITQYTLFDRVRGESGLYDCISQYSYPMGKDGRVVILNSKGEEKEIQIPIFRLKESEEEKGIPVLEILSDTIEEEQNDYYIEEIEKVLTVLGMEEWEIIETDELIETMEEQKSLSYLPDPDLPPIIISQWWINQIAAKYPELIRLKEEAPEDEEDF